MLRTDYAMLHEIIDFHKERGDSKQAIENNTFVRDLKKRIREHHIREQEYAENEPQWHYRDYDSRWCKIVYDSLPEEWYDAELNLTREEAIKEYREDEWWHWYNPYNDGRDCTGVWFTFNIYVFPIPEEHKTIVYHSQSCDV